MKAVQLNSFERRPGWIAVVDIPDPVVIGPGEVEVAILASPINPSDVLRLSGGYFHPMALPFQPGAEGVGRVVRVGLQVAGLAAGDLVIMLTAGNWVQRRVLPAAAVHKVPAAADLTQLAMLLVNPGTAWMMLHHVRALTPGDWIIQNAANSAVGRLVIRFARELGCKTINVVRAKAAADAVERAGGDLVLVDGPDLLRRMEEVVGRSKVRLGLDAIAGAATGRIAACLGVGAHLVTYGMLSGEDCQIPVGVLIGSELTCVGLRLRGEVMRSIDMSKTYDALAQRLLAGERFNDVGGTCALEDIDDVLAQLPAALGGKILLLPNGPLPACTPVTPAS
ncbi:zinc-dependent alcohol dehydrogenase family protein [Hydrogenophaga sp. BPS33]|uniref:zinc-dependent alcohol dehydrogenase family protein n=1 Tax=Hydrogenophaga sp. BPS33 TaxID=2651974 RepID=UPI00135729A0|nr:zinc-dependent alcohol dehydrogenase family protein [Hydrogenophaga sp. BPS33]